LLVQKNESGSFELDVYEPLPKIEPTPQETTFYGGEFSLEGGKNTSFGLGFPGTGVNSENYFAYAVVKELLGACGIPDPQLGDCSGGRLYHIGDKNDWIFKAKTFNFSYTDNGLIGFVAETKGGHSKELYDLLLTQVKNLQTITEDELSRAKSKAKGKLTRASECRINIGTSSALRSFSGVNLLTLSEELQGIDKVNLAQVRSIAQKLSTSKPSIVTLGDIRGAPK